MMQPQNESVAKLHEETGITEATLYKWRKKARTGGSATPGNGQTSDKWSNHDKRLFTSDCLSSIGIYYIMSYLKMPKGFTRL